MLVDHWRRLMAWLDEKNAFDGDAGHVFVHEKPEQLKSITCGLAGTGKSYILRRFVQTIESLRHGPSSMVMITAPTGVAAKGGNGTTNHRGFGLRRTDGEDDFGGNDRREDPEGDRQFTDAMLAL